MRVRELRKGDIRDAVRILILSFEKVLFNVFKDLELAREVFFEYFEENTDGCYVAEEERIVGFAYVSFKKQKFGSFFRNKLGFINGTRIALLMSYICPKPKRDEVVINFLAVSPLRSSEEICSALLRRIVEDARNANKKKIRCLMPIDSDLLDVFTKFGFEIRKVIDNRFAERNFGSRVWYVMELKL